jgi:adenosylcobyric acid synthase
VPPPGEHGGDGLAVARALGLDPDDVLDLSVTCNPLAPDLRAEAMRAVARGALARYPLPEALRRLEERLAVALGVPAELVVATAGGASAIAIVAQALGAGRVEEPEFSLYRRHLQALGASLGEGPRWRSNPRNPTGELAAPDEHAGVWDEAFYPLAAGQWTRGDVARGSVVVGSLTKTFACPGLRIGYAVAPDERLAMRLRALRPAWPLGGLECWLGPWLLDRVDLARTVARLHELRAALVALLERVGLVTEAHAAPWVLVHDVPGLRQALARRGVVVRDLSSFGMHGSVRIAVPDERGLERLEQALEALGWSASGERRVPVGGPEARAERSRRGRRSRIRGALVVVGTGSDVGKSVVVAGLCRLLARRGVRVAPFKAQNMSLNAAVGSDGLELARAQAAQAAAAGVEPECRMNPILLKPTGPRRSQVVLLGRPIGELDWRAYELAKPGLEAVVHETLDELRRRFDVVVIEGAGGAAEVNLLDGDLANLPLAARARVPALLVADVDRGGMLASVVGTHALLPEELRRWLRGFLVNKLRGDAALLAPGIELVERRTGLRCIGTLPFLDGLPLDAEDTVALLAAGGLARYARGAPVGEPPIDAGDADGRVASIGYGCDPTPHPTMVDVALDVAVVAVPRIANATDVEPLGLEPTVAVRLVRRAEELGSPDLVVLPGSKATLDDLAWLRASGLADALGRLSARPDGPAILGICGGYQMLGRLLEDGVESSTRTVEGLGWLPVCTRFMPSKLTRQVRVAVRLPSGDGALVRLQAVGYEIRHGRVAVDPEATRCSDLVAFVEPASPAVGAGEALGVADFERGVLGTSVHGLLEADEVRAALLAWVARRRGREAPPAGRSFVEARWSRLEAVADAIEQHVDLDALFELVAEGALA